MPQSYEPPLNKRFVNKHRLQNPDRGVLAGKTAPSACGESWTDGSGEQNEAAGSSTDAAPPSRLHASPWCAHACAFARPSVRAHVTPWRAICYLSLSLSLSAVQGWSITQTRMGRRTWKLCSRIRLYLYPFPSQSRSPYFRIRLCAHIGTRVRACPWPTWARRRLQVYSIYFVFLAAHIVFYNNILFISKTYFWVLSN